MKIYDRHTRTYKEAEQYGAGKLAFLYGNPFGRLLLKIAISPFVSRIYGKMRSTRSSALKIPQFIVDHDIDISEYEEKDYTSFNDFFCRRFREGVRPVGDGLISPADSKLLVYDIKPDTGLLIKGRDYLLSEITGMDEGALKEFAGGKALVFRLCMDDCHRYCFPASGNITGRYFIKGRLHTVSPISSAHKIYSENTRCVSFMETEEFGKMCFIEVGAILVGKIVDGGKTSFRKGDEKGYFEIGGSTIVVLIRDGIKIDEDIMEQSRMGIETTVRYGERIGDNA